MNGLRIALILLAAGRATRFGGGKLGAELAGKPLACHAADNLNSLPLFRRFVIYSPQTPELPDFIKIPLDPPDAPLSRSIATGVAALTDEDAALFALADMPLVPTAHFAALIARFDGDRIATRVDGRNMVPAIFGRQHFATLASLVGDRGAGVLLQDAPSIDLAPAQALDVDTQDDLERAQVLLGAPRCI
ncbi:MAG: nucleotidyltransferase family protein [Novosphingobium sp.]|uniref:nucleotidyltransferase family protein n=1 Tax=Novosphingobium sp. TaxID=1874826 RepID=UPI003B9AD63D